MTDKTAPEKEEDGKPDVLPISEKDEQTVRSVFGEGGLLEQNVAGFRPRESQTEMAVEIARAILNREQIIAEAGTGTGKTYAYLIPAVYYGERVIISTGTKNLQDQLFLRDIPAVRDAIGVGFTASLLKGRSNYICHYYLSNALARGDWSPKDAASLASIARFAKTTETGDIADCHAVAQTDPIWAFATSKRETCLRQKCPFANECFVTKARTKAAESDITVVNHHLYFADLALKRKDPQAGMLPNADTVVFDEAHQIADVASQYLGSALSAETINDFVRDVRREGFTRVASVADWTTLTDKAVKAMSELRLMFGRPGRLSFDKIDLPLFALKLQDLQDAVDAIAEAIDANRAVDEIFEVLSQRAFDIRDFLGEWIVYAEGSERSDDVLWVDVTEKGVSLNVTPISVAGVFSSEDDRTCRVFTSATLSVKKDFTYFSERLGLGEVISKTWESPFDYASNALLYIPEHLPDPFNSSEHLEASLEEIAPLVAAVDGGTFILCTSYRAIEFFREHLPAALSYLGVGKTVFVQGDAGKNDLLEAFRKNGNAVLIATASFWEGVDVKGDALSLVVIDKLPFNSPGDPVYEARINAMKRDAGNPFMAFQVPDAVVSLRQGAGRLIRDETDRGVLVICDSRIHTKRYGSIMWKSLPPFSRTKERADAVAFLKKLGGRTP